METTRVHDVRIARNIIFFIAHPSFF